ncbi:MAG: response regulator [Dehalococcoidia bacterium]
MRTHDGQPTALVAEDHPAYLGRVTALLEELGLRTVGAVAGAQAIAYLAGGGTADLLVTDLDMPHENGWAVIDAWLARGRTPETVVMVTGEADDRTVQERCAAGGICLIHKAALDARLADAIRNALAGLDGA